MKALIIRADETISVEKIHGCGSLEKYAIDTIRAVSGRKIIIYTPGHRQIANRIAVEVPDTDLFEILDLSKVIIETTKRSKDLGYQLASEIFCEESAFTRINIFVIGYEKLVVSDRYGKSARLTDVFLSSFFHYIDPKGNKNRVYLISKSGEGLIESIIGKMYRFEISEASE